MFEAIARRKIKIELNKKMIRDCIKYEVIYLKPSWCQIISQGQGWKVKKKWPGIAGSEALASAPVSP